MSQKMKNHPYFFTDSPILRHSCWQFRPLKMRLICCFETAETKYPVAQHHIPEQGTPQPVFREIQNSENVFTGQQYLLTSATRRERTLRVLCNFIGPTPLPFEEKQHTPTARCSYSI